MKPLGVMKNLYLTTVAFLVCFLFSNNQLLAQGDPTDCITFTGCPAVDDQPLKFCADETVNGDLGTTLGITDFPSIMASHDCLGNGSGQSFGMNFELNEQLLGEDCWDFHYISRVGGDGGHVKLFSGSHPESNDSYIVTPYLYMNAGYPVTIGVNYSDGDYDLSLYIIDEFGVESGLLDTVAIDDYFGFSPGFGTITLDPNILVDASYRVKFVFSYNGSKPSNSNTTDDISVSGIIVDGDCTGGIDFTLSGPADTFYPVGEHTITYTATFIDPDGNITTDTCDFDIVIVGVTLNIIPVNPDCNGLNSSITAVAGDGLPEHGTGPYTYNLYQGVNLISTNSTGIFTPIAVGDYTVTVVDSSLDPNPGCTTTSNIISITTTPDIINPSITCPGDLTAVCSVSEQPAYTTYLEFTNAGGSALDNCSLNEASFILLDESSDNATCPETVTRTYQITDNSGNAATCIQTITVSDTIDPTASNPTAIPVQCIGDVPAQDISVVTDANDNCPIAPVVAWVSDSSDGLSCPETITRTYSVTDACNNQILVTQAIIINDTTNPTASNPAAIPVQCIGDVPAQDISVVTDANDNCPIAPVVAWVSDSSDGLSCPETITRTYSVTDACNNQILVTQAIIINDTTNPTASNPAAIPVQCIGDVPAQDISVVTDANDNCPIAPVVAWVSDSSDGLSCPETITRTYSVTDACNNQILVTQAIIINDTTNPTASNPAAIPVQCIGDVPAQDISVVTDANDNCPIAPVVAWVSDSSDGLSCPETITRTYSVTDACNNQILVTQAIIINDTTNPTASNPAAIPVQCIGDVPAQDISVVTDANDNCPIAPVVAWVSDSSDGLSCPETITRTYSVTDACNNQILVTQAIIINDTTNPTASNPAAIPVQCIGDVPAQDISVVTDANDNCPIAPVVAWVSDSSDGLSCPETITRTYSVTDACNNQILVTQAIIINDTTNPTASNPAAIPVQCIGDVPAQDISVVTDANDNCPIAPVVAWVSDSSDGLSCPETITRTYSVTDACNNQILVTQAIIINDTTNPTASNPAAIPVQCIGDVPAQDISVVTDANDNCPIAPVVAWVSDSSDGLSCPETITRTYSVTDACNNQILVTQAIIINDTTNPTASNPAAIPVQCIGDVPAQDISVVTDANDNCPIAPVVAWVSDSSDGLSCPETITRTYSVTDACNNQILVTQAIIINDTTNPTASNPAAIPVQCIGDVPAQDISVVTDANDNCPIAPVVAWVSDSSDGLSCPETITRTYSVTDACNNQILVTQAIIINDTTAPDITSCNLNLNTPSTCDAATNESIADQWNLDNIAALQACATDNCDTDLTINSNYDFVNLNQECGPCGTLSVTYNVLDDCGNNSPITLNLSFNDNTPPDLTNCSVGNETLECDGTNNEAIADQWNLDNIAALEACAEDDTDITVTSNYAFVNLNTTCGLGGVIPVLYTITDECGGAAILNVTLTLEDTTPPDLSGCAVTSQTLECDGINNEAIADQWNLDNIAALEGCVGDSCDPDFSGQVTSDYAFSNLSSTCGLGGTIAVIYTITDDCGNAETLNATLTLEDTTPPDLSGCAVTSQALECDGVNNEAIADQWNLDNIAALEGCVADSCDPDFSGQVTSDYAFSNLSSTCGLGGTIAVIYTITDDCGNAETLNATLTLEDTTPPDLSGCAVTSQTLECDGVNNEAIADQWNLDNIAALEGCVADSCDPDFSGQVTSDYAFSNLSSTCGLGGTIAVIYTVVDDCNNEITLSVTLTLEDTTPPDLSGCAVTNQVLECTDDNQAAADAWNEANIAALEACVSDSCDPDFSGQVTSDYDFANLNTTCGPCGTLNVNYTITDDCGNSSTLNAILSFDDITIPDLSNCNVNDLTLECDGTNNETLADQWNLDNIAALETCADDLNITVSSNYAFTNLVTSCGLGGTIPVTYTVTDDCDNSATLNVILTLEDTTPPDLVNCTVTDETLECAGDDNESIADAWNNANITALETCGTDSCDVDNTFVVTSDYDFANLSVTCGAGGTITIIYTVSDDCNNSQQLTAILTLADTTPPDLVNCTVIDETLECAGEDNQSIADAWNNANIDSATNLWN